MNPSARTGPHSSGELVRYLVVGLAVTGFDYVLFLALYPRAVLPVAALNLVTMSCATVLGLLLHRRYTFRSSRPLTLALVARYAGIAALNYGLATGVLLGVLALGGPAWIAKGLAIGAAVAVSFVLSRRLLRPDG